MAHISSIGAGLFTDLSIFKPAVALSSSALAALDTAGEFQALFATEIASDGGTPATGTFVRVKDIREFPEIGVPPNITNVPVYGSKTSQQIQGQSDFPSQEITLNFVPSRWASGTILGAMVGDGLSHVIRFTLLNSEPAAWDSGVSGLGVVQNTQYYWIGKLEALSITPSLTDANTAKLTLTVQSKLFGAYTI